LSEISLLTLPLEPGGRPGRFLPMVPPQAAAFSGVAQATDAPLGAVSSPMDIVRRMDERRLVEACLRKERKAQEMLYKRHYGRMMGLCLRYARDRDEAEAMLNQGFFKVFETLERFDPDKGKLEGWIYRIVLHAAIDHYRSVIRPNRAETVDPAEGPDHADEAENALDRMAAEEILAMVQRLTPKYRAVFNLYAIEGYTHPEIAEALGISEGTSKSNFAKARRNLQAMIRERDAAQERRYAR
jgi:RNA polymerase sigma factor (sigma-70 family)